MTGAKGPAMRNCVVNREPVGTLPLAIGAELRRHVAAR
jgi:hypothetical protein